MEEVAEVVRTTYGSDSMEKSRTNAWDFIIGGGGLFNNLDMSFTTTDPAGKNSSGRQSLLRPQLGTLKKFIEGFDFIRMKPDSTVIKGWVTEGVSAVVLSEPGVAYAIYLRKLDLKDITPVTGELAFDLPSGNYKAVWLDPTTGKLEPETTFTHPGGEKKLNSPLFDLDIALDIRRMDSK